ncbi:MAG: hypothetical protein HC899_33980 [Leptolyngbyaceae cyanobacterium SM1_4_3]|nr:hypothetical protein [Leptolyngbyaceae cyanobacterium SM1_4_3]
MLIAKEMIEQIAISQLFPCEIVRSPFTIASETGRFVNAFALKVKLQSRRSQPHL